MQRYLKQAFLSLFLALVGAQGEILLGASLEENSPFIPFDYVGPQAAPIVGPQKGGVELRGVLAFDDEARFSLYNPTTQKSVWVKLKDKRAPYFVDSYDPVKQTITVTVNGLRQQLHISKPGDEMASSGGASRPPVNVPVQPPRIAREPEPIEEDDDDDDPADLPEDEETKRRREMSEKVYEAFKKYVSEKRGQS